MKSRRTIAIVVVAVATLATHSWAAKAQKVPATFTLPCVCTHCSGTARWAEKTDPGLPPSNSKPTSITPSEIAAWKGPGPNDGIKTKGPGAARISAEQRWYQLTGRVTLLRLEGDGDIHIQLQDVDQAKTTKHGQPRQVVVEIPAGQGSPREALWCGFRTTALAWTDFDSTKPVTTSDKEMKLNEHPVITVVGKAFYDVDHAPKGHKGNKRSPQQYLSVWEIHPVMDLQVSGN